MNNSLLSFEPDFLLRMKMEKVSRENNKPMEFIVLKAIESFLSAEGYNNPSEVYAASAGNL